MIDFLKEEKSICSELEEICVTEPKNAYSLILSLIAQCTDEQKQNPPQSAALSRIICRFLMHRKNKSRLVPYLTQDNKISHILFGELNTYKYSLVFLLRRLIRLNDTELTKGLLELLCSNPYRDDSSKDYSDRWSLSFILKETLDAPDDYLALSDESKSLIEGYFPKN